MRNGGLAKVIIRASECVGSRAAASESIRVEPPMALGRALLG